MPVTSPVSHRLTVTGLFRARFDKTGRVVRVNLHKLTVVVSVGLGQWEVPFDEVLPAPG